MSQAARRLIENFDALPEEDRKSVTTEIVRRSTHPNLLQSDLLGLDTAERIQLVEDLWDSVAAEVEDVPFTEEEWAEIQKLRAEHAQDPSSAIPWEEVRTRLYRRFS